MTCPGGSLSRIFGRAETMRETYLDRLQNHFEALEKLAHGMGWQLVRHTTNEPLTQGGARLTAALENFGARI